MTANRLTLCLLSVMALQSVAAQTPTQGDPATEACRVVRRDLAVSNFVGAIETLGKLPDGDLAKNPELLTLRGIAQWGAALRKCESLTLITTEFGMVRKAYRFLQQEKERFVSDPDSSTRVDETLAAIADDLLRCTKNARKLGTDASEVDRLLQGAESDFGKAALLNPRSQAAWCAVPEAWGLLVKVHRFFLLHERARSADAAPETSPRAGTEADVNLHAPSAAQLAELERQINEAIVTLLQRADKLPSPAAAAQSVADALLLTASCAGRIDDWVRQSTFSRLGPPGQTGVETGNKPPGVKRLADLASTAVGDPVQSAVALYEYAYTRMARPAEQRARYSAYAVVLPQSRSTAAELLKAITPTGEMQAVVHLERARLASAAQGNDVVALAEVIRACALGRLVRPALSAAPPPIRAAFLRASALLLRSIGPHIGSGNEQVCRLLTEMSKTAPSPELQLRYAVSRIRLAQLLTTSDLPWDRALGYKEASAALARVSGFENLLSDAQLAAFAALEARMAKSAVEEAFPPSSFYVVGGRASWSRDPFSAGRTRVRDPAVAVFADGAIMTTITEKKR